MAGRGILSVWETHLNQILMRYRHRLAKLVKYAAACSGRQVAARHSNAQETSTGGSLSGRVEGRAANCSMDARKLRAGSLGRSLVNMRGVLSRSSRVSGAERLDKARYITKTATFSTTLQPTWSDSATGVMRLNTVANMPTARGVAGLRAAPNTGSAAIANTETDASDR